MRNDKNLSVLILCGVLLLIQGCKKETAATGKEVNTKMITSGTWTMESVIVSGVDKTSIYAGLKLTFTATSYTAVNGGAIWRNGDTWSFIDDTGTEILRGDGLHISVTNIAENSLALALIWDETTLGGRSSSISGEHVFIFSK